MRLLARFIIILLRICEKIAWLLLRVQQFLTGILPTLWPPEELNRLIRSHYDSSYRDGTEHNPAEAYGTGLLEWEEDVLARHKMASGTTVVLGAGVGRESIELARRGLHVIGLDISRDALRLAALTARETSTSVTFIQASFYDIPTLPGHIDYIFLSGIMYSSIPGRQARQAWLRKLHTHLREGGLTVLSYYNDRAKEPRSGRLAETFYSWLAGLPGANPTYQPGDLVAQDHFLHAFLNEEELRSELTEAGATILQLNWDKQFTVLSWPHETVYDE